MNVERMLWVLAVCQLIQALAIIALAVGQFNR